MDNPLPKQFKRNALGLVEGVEYRYTEDGLIDWKAMIPPQYLVIKPESEKDVVSRYGRDLRDIDPREIADRYLLILLGGIKHLLRLRGYRSVTTTIPHSTNYKAVAVCTIEFLPNFETEGQPQTFSDSSAASLDSVSGVFQLHLEATATNRAFVRAVRNGLGLNITAKDEYDEVASREYKPTKGTEAPKISEPSGHSPSSVLATRCAELKISFEKVKERASEIKANLAEGTDPQAWSDWGSIQSIDAYTLLNRINQTAAAKKTQKVA